MTKQSRFVAKPEDLPPGQSLQVTVDGKEVALFNVDGAYYAVGGRCPHRSGPLAKGRVEKVPGTAAAVPGTDVRPGAEVLAVRCPLHGWLFELETGKCLTRPGSGVAVYPVSCQGEALFLGPPEGEAAGPTLAGQIQ